MEKRFGQQGGIIIAVIGDVKNNILARGEITPIEDLHVAILDSNRDIAGRQTPRQADPVQDRDLLRTVIDNLPDAIYVKDIEARKVLVNLADARNLGCKTEAEALGKTDFDLFPKEIAENFFQDDQLVLQKARKSSTARKKLFSPTVKYSGCSRPRFPGATPTARSSGLSALAATLPSKRKRNAS